MGDGTPGASSAATRDLTVNAQTQNLLTMNATSIDKFPPARLDDRRAVPLPPALSGERVQFGALSYYVVGNGPPLVLIHSMNASPSAAEVRPLFERHAATRTVFALDLPGCGFSSRANRRYDPRVMTDALHQFAEQVRERCGDVCIDALAVSIGCEFLARAASERPAEWGRLAFVSPTGLDGTKSRRGPPGSTRAIPGLHALVSARPWAQALYRTLTRPAVIRYFMQRTWGSQKIDETLWAYDVLNAREPGARFAALSFLSGELFSGDIHLVYEAVVQPVWMSHGVRGDFTDFRGRALLRDRGNWRVSTFQTGALPYFEVMPEFALAMDAFFGASTKKRAAPAMRPVESFVSRDAFRERNAVRGR